MAWQRRSWKWVKTPAGWRKVPKVKPGPTDVQHGRGYVTEEKYTRPLDGPVWRLRKREYLFVEHYFARIILATPELVGMEPKLQRAAMRELAISAMLPAGYRMAKKSTQISRRHAEYLMDMPRIQQALSTKFDESGFTMSKATQLLYEIAAGTVKQKRQIAAISKSGKAQVVDLEDDVPVSDRLKAIDMRMRLTTGYAPTKSASVVANMNSEQFFKENDFESDAPPIDVRDAPVIPPAALRHAEEEDADDDDDDDDDFDEDEDDDGEYDEDYDDEGEDDEK